MLVVIGLANRSVKSKTSVLLAAWVLFVNLKPSVYLRLRKGDEAHSESLQSRRNNSSNGVERNSMQTDRWYSVLIDKLAVVARISGLCCAVI